MKLVLPLTVLFLPWSVLADCTTKVFINGAVYCDDPHAIETLQAGHPAEMPGRPTRALNQDSSTLGRASEARSPHVVHTRSLRGQHSVEARITGPDGAATVPLIVDTGSNSVALPQSMIRTLGFKLEDLQDGMAATAGGKIPTKLAKLKSVTVGRVSADDVLVSFVPDQYLGNIGLLGMSFLGRFMVTIDQRRNELVLLAK